MGVAPGAGPPVGPSPFVRRADGVSVEIRLQPRAGRARLGPVVVDAEGRAALKAAVTAAPEDGRANAALIELMAREWKLPKSAIALLRGAADRRKALLIADADPDALLARLSALLDPRG